ncbi:ribosome biogenesis GTPase Der [Nitrococcus mobilis]|uniref:GTPase Der n=1 Tax=Nitrococcus mobilis Nb-231 TaxID=314278 RepID=A4BM15_9GAMM|nr:ribosome biogenesis GTPase Der [Nitrococcus mobilis]EAR23353.1 GTP-binding protein EngA [Nitrococcus mobilis Nb-231]
MEPVIVLVGRPNVGKSTLFNCLTRSRDALVADFPELTRDRQYGRGRIGPCAYIVVDTGGMGQGNGAISEGVQAQARQAIAQADAVLFLVDARSGPTAADEALAGELRAQGKQLFLVPNKVDGLDARVVAADFYTLGLGDPHPIAAAHGTGVARLMASVLQGMTAAVNEVVEPPYRRDTAVERIRVAIVGRPNVGKSTLINRLLGEERVLVHDQPGTTRDSIFIPFERDGFAYTLIDTAGMRRRSRVYEAVEKFSAIKTLQAVTAAQVVILLLDAHESITEQDVRIIGYVLDAGRALVLAVNKWDGLEPSRREQIRRGLERKLGFLDFAKLYFISALYGTGVGLLYGAVQQAYASSCRKLDTPQLNRILTEAVAAHQPPLVRGRRVKLRYAHQGGRNPPVIVIHGNQTARLTSAYRRYLVNIFQRQLGLWGTPIRLELRAGSNPYAGRVNVLSPRQQARRKRLLAFVKRNRSRRKRG